MAQATHVTSAIGTLITGAGAKQSTGPIRAVHAKLVAALPGHPSRAFPLDRGAIDLRPFRPYIPRERLDPAAREDMAGRVA
jgi:hypothetical protein